MYSRRHATRSRAHSLSEINEIETRVALQTPLNFYFSYPPQNWSQTEPVQFVKELSSLFSPLSLVLKLQSFNCNVRRVHVVNYQISECSSDPLVATVSCSVCHSFVIVVIVVSNCCNISY